MKIENGNQHPANANGFANLNRHGGSAGETARTNGIAAANRQGNRTYEGKSGGSHIDGHMSQRYDRNETGGKIGTPTRQHYDSTKDLGTRNRHDTFRHDQWDIKGFDKRKDSQHFYGNRHNYDNQRNYDHYHGKKFILHKPEQLHKLDIRSLDKHKNIFFHPIPSRVRINIKNLDLNKHLMRPLMPMRPLYHNRSSITIINLNVHNVPNFKLGGINHHNQIAPDVKVKNADIYGLDEKKMASVLRLTELTMRIKQECYGNKLNYDKEYEKALKSWVGHFGGTYVPRENEKHGHDNGHAHAHSGHNANKPQISKPQFAQFAHFKLGAQKHQGKYYIADNHFGRWDGGKNNFHKDLFSWKKH